MTDAEYIASFFHCYYEELAPQFNYETRPESAVKWEDVPENNRNLMIAVAQKLMDEDIIQKVYYRRSSFKSHIP